MRFDPSDITGKLDKGAVVMVEKLTDSTHESSTVVDAGHLLRALMVTTATTDDNVQLAIGDDGEVCINGEKADDLAFVSDERKHGFDEFDPTGQEEQELEEDEFLSSLDG